MRSLFCLFLLLVFTLSLGCAANRPPNLIVILADDLGYADLGCFGAKGFKTPAIDRLAAEGVKLTSFYSGSPACSPTRASLMTGRYPIRFGCAGGVYWPDSTDGMPADEVTIAEVLKERGYATACVGKWHLGTQPALLPTSQGFDHYFGIPYSNDMGQYDQFGLMFQERYHRVRDSGCELYRDEVVIEESPDQRWLTERYTIEAESFIASNANRPFFLYFAHAMPHLPLFVSDAFRGSSERGLYGDVIQEIDGSVGRVLAALEQHDIADDTLVVFTSDNGPWLKYGDVAGSAEPLRGGKATTWEGGQRVPFVARYPKLIQPGIVSDEVTSTNDLMPTLASIAGAPMPSDRVIDGRDLTDLLACGADLPDRPFFYFTHIQGGLEAVRLGRWKYHVAKRGTRQERGFEPRLHDLASDPSEQLPVLDKSDLAESLAELLADMKAELAAAGS